MKYIYFGKRANNSHIISHILGSSLTPAVLPPTHLARRPSVMVAFIKTHKTNLGWTQRKWVPLCEEFLFYFFLWEFAVFVVVWNMTDISTISKEISLSSLESHASVLSMLMSAWWWLISDYYYQYNRKQGQGLFTHSINYQFISKYTYMGQC